MFLTKLQFNKLVNFNSINFDLKSVKLLSTFNRKYDFLDLESTGDYQFLERCEHSTDKYESDLPKLPKQNLETTCQLYLDAISPLINDNQMKSTERCVNDFKKGVGMMLHENYNYSYWEDFLYSRDSIIYSNGSYIFKSDLDSKNDLVQRATNVLINFLRFRRSSLDKVLKPEKFDLYPLKNIFSTTRMPKEGRDFIEHFGDNQKHVVFLRKGQFYCFDVLDQDGYIRPPEQIYNFIHNLIEHKQNDDDQSITALCTLDRDDLVKVRNRLENLTEKNSKNLNLIDSAITVICLDEESFYSEESDDRSKDVLFGLYGKNNLQRLNRWLDKNQFVISKSGMGLNFEHSLADGMFYCYMINKINSNLTTVHQQYLSDLRPESNKFDINGSKLEFDLDDFLKDQLSNSLESYSEIANSTKMSTINYTKMDKNYLKAKNISADFVCQLSYQYAYKKMFNKLAMASSPVSLSHFSKVRATEMSTLTMKLKEACDALLLGDRKYSVNELRNILEMGSNKHKNLCKQAKNGKLFYRMFHQFKLLSKKMNLSPMPSIFEDPSYQIAFHPQLDTTSALGDNIFSAHFIPMFPDSIGISYGFTYKGLVANCIGTENQDTDQFCDAVIQCLEKIYSILEKSA